MLRVLFSFVLLAIAGCGGDANEGQNEGTGTLQFEMQVGANGKGSRAVEVCTIQDVRTILYQLWVTPDTVKEGEVDDLEWFSILQSDQEMLGSQRSGSAQLPVGEYASMKIRQRNRLYFVSDCPGIGVIELPDLNDAELDPEADSPLSVINLEGLWYFDSQDRFTLTVPQEKMGGFEIQEGRTTLLRWVLNFNTLEWTDADDSGTWTDGDILDNWTLVDGKQTMFDFVVEFLD